jgi:hypothetical protein
MPTFAVAIGDPTSFTDGYANCFTELNGNRRSDPHSNADRDGHPNPNAQRYFYTHANPNSHSRRLRLDFGSGAAHLDLW